jgi:hypothetical protein
VPPGGELSAWHVPGKRAAWPSCWRGWHSRPSATTGCGSPEQPCGSGCGRSRKPRFAMAHRKIRVLLNLEGWKVGKKLVYRLYHEEGLALRHKPRRKRRASLQLREPRRTQPIVEPRFHNRPTVAGLTRVVTTIHKKLVVADPRWWTETLQQTCQRVRLSANTFGHAFLFLLLD